MKTPLELKRLKILLSFRTFDFNHTASVCMLNGKALCWRLFSIFRTMAESLPKQYNEDVVREVIRKTKTALLGSIDSDRILDHMFSERVLNSCQHDRLVKYRKNEGQSSATGQLLEMVMKKEVQATDFMKTLSQQLPWVEEEIQKGVEGFKSGE